MSTSRKITHETIIVVSNLTSGGAVVYMNSIISKLSKHYRIIHHSPNAYMPQSKNKIYRLLEYIYYVMFYLRSYYNDLATELNKTNAKKIVVFQDSYIKTPNIFRLLNHKYVYIFHEPPREFYENMLLHTENIYNILFNMLIRLPIYFIDRYNMSHAKHLISNSQYSKSNLQKIYGKESKVVYPGFDNTISFKIPKKKYKCISVGSLLPYKGHQLVIESLGKITDGKPSLTIVGGGSNKRKVYLENLAKKNNVRLNIISSISDSQLANEYLESFTYVNGAQNEPFGLTSLEAIGYGCNLVTNDTGGTKELAFFYKDKVFVSRNNSDDMSKKIVESLAYKSKSVPDMSNFSWDSVAQSIDML